MASLTDVEWHTKSVEEVFRALRTGRDGLSTEEARRRLDELGQNVLRREAATSPAVIFLHQFKEFLIIILIIAAAVSALLGEVLDAAVIFSIVVLSTLLGFLQEYRASQALEALKRMAAPAANVVRDGQEQKIPAREIVPGDIVLLSVGGHVPADGRVIETYNLKVNESAFTGESEPVDKQTDPLPPELPLAERANMLFAGTTVIGGRGVAAVAATGMRTEFGKIAHLVQTGDGRHTPLERRMEEIGRRLSAGALAIVAVIVSAGLWHGDSLVATFLFGVSLAVAAVPEALPAVVSGALTIGVQRMVRRNAVVRRLPAVETLGSVTMVCSDKTGTLTRNEMTVRHLWLGERDIEVKGVGYALEGELVSKGQHVGQDPDISWLARVAILCNDAHLLRDESGRHYISGDPTEGALLVLAAKAGFEPEPVRIDYPRVEEIPFNSIRKCMTTIHQTPQGDWLACSKGAAEVILRMCTHYQLQGRVLPLTQAVRQRIAAADERMAEQALRVLSLAYRELPNHFAKDFEETAEKDLVFLGLVGMFDPPREEVKAAIAKAEQAGVRTVMITGDHKLTGVAIGHELGLLKDGNIALSGADLDRLSDRELSAVAEHATVYARTSPEHKLRLVSIFQSKGQVVAMTGDGINDAPALRRADIGIAMGVAGTDVTKEAADLVLSDDNYATIVAAIEEGRIIFDNIRKFIRYLLSTNSGEILTMFMAAAIGFPTPLLAIQILWINLVTDGLPALALGVEPAEPELMQRPPRHPQESVFARGLWQHVVWVGIFMAAGTLGVMFWGLMNYPLDSARTMVFLILASFQMFHVLAIRSERESVFAIGLFSNIYLVGAVALTFALQFAVTYVPTLQTTFHTTSLDVLQLAVCLGVASLLFWAVETEKWLQRRFAAGKAITRTA